MATVEEQIIDLEKEIRDTPYDKSTEKHHGILRARLSKLKDKLEEGTRLRKTSSGKGGYAVRKQGDATVVLVGPPSAGKSTLINKLTNAESKVAPYAFTTVTVIPGMLKYRNAYIQILDVPGLLQGAQEGKGRGKEVLSVVRGSDLLIIMTDPERIKALDTMTTELENAGIRINKRPPHVRITKMGGGGLSIQSNIKQELDKLTIREVAWEYGIKNGEIALKEKLNMETLIDAFAPNRVYVPALFVVNKIDTTSHPGGRRPIGSTLDEMLSLRSSMATIGISAEKGTGIDELKEQIWEKLGFVTIYLVRGDTPPSNDNPMIMKRSQNLADVANKIGSEFAEGKTAAKIWGSGSKFAGQEVSLTTQVVDGMMVRFV